MTDISFRDYRKNDIHGVILYPATMIAPMQTRLMEDLFSQEIIKSVYDPYHGSGTALFEAAQLSPECAIFGCDINPLAYLITRVKLKGVGKNIEKDINILFKNIEKSPGYEFSFHNITKWFREDIIDSLKKIKWAIRQTETIKNRLFFWLVFAEIIRKYSNTRSATYKLHIKNNEDILKLKNNLIEDFKQHILASFPKFSFSCKNVYLMKGDVLNQGKKISEKSIDLTITSPPYGDNATTVTYGQFSSLALMWIDSNDLNLEGWELDNYSKIDNMSLGGSLKNQISETGLSLILPYLNQINENKRKKVLAFFADYFLSLDDIVRVTNKYIIMTLGNRTVDGININLTSITSNYLENYGFKLVNSLSRDIPMKRIPKITSRVKEASVSSMNQEFVIILKKYN